jgi:phosphatidylserine decarboxylase precursor
LSKKKEKYIFMKIAYLVLMQLLFFGVVCNGLQSVSNIVCDNNDVLDSAEIGTLQVREEIELQTPGMVSFLYSNPLGKMIAPLCTRSAFASNIAGWYADSNTSRKNIAKFIRAYKINTAEAEKEITQYSTLNDFFTRKLKSGARTFDSSSKAFCSPADGKLLIVEHLSADSLFPIKGAQFNYEQLLGSDIQKTSIHSSSKFKSTMQKKNKKTGRRITDQKHREFLRAEKGDGEERKINQEKNDQKKNYQKETVIKKTSGRGQYADAEYYKDGTAFVVRLSPGDYHRFHAPISGTPHYAYTIPGFFDSVDPLVYASGKQPLLGNQRVVFEMNSIYGFRIAIIAVGALCVGRITTTYIPDRFIHKGHELGYFSFGGSTIVIIVPAGRMRVDKKYSKHSMRQRETAILAGSRIAEMY